MAHDSQVGIAGGGNQCNPNKRGGKPVTISGADRPRPPKNPPGAIGFNGSHFDPPHLFLPMADDDSGIEVPEGGARTIDHDHGPGIEAHILSMVEGDLPSGANFRHMALHRGIEGLQDIDDIPGPGGGLHHPGGERRNGGSDGRRGSGRAIRKTKREDCTAQEASEGRRETSPFH